MASTCVLTTLGIDFLNSFPSSVIIQSAVVEWLQTVRGGWTDEAKSTDFLLLAHSQNTENRQEAKI